jgi:hypothetical protein
MREAGRIEKTRLMLLSVMWCDFGTRSGFTSWMSGGGGGGSKKAGKENVVLPKGVLVVVVVVEAAAGGESPPLSWLNAESHKPEQLPRSQNRRSQQCGTSP